MSTPGAPLPIAPDAAALIARIEAHDPRPGDVIALDADGTLWAGDVGDDLMYAAIEAGLFREPIRPGLQAVLEQSGLPTDGDLPALVRRIDAGFRAGQVPEQTTYEMMTWAYAGLGENELDNFARAALTAAGLPGRVHPAIPEVLAYAEASGLWIQIVSASPIAAVRAGLALTGLPARGVAAGQPAVEAGVLQPRLARPLPYAHQKVVAAREAIGGARWLASFGDSAFDVELLAAAALAVVVGRRAGLRARLGEIGGDKTAYEP